MVLWDLKQKQAVREFEHPGTVWCVAISPKEEVFATGCGNTIRFFRYSDNKPFRQLEGHTRDVRTVVFFPDGEHLASGSYDGTIRIWKWREGKETKRLVGHKGMVGCLAVSLDGKSILSCGREDSSVRLWAVDTGDELQRFDGHQGNVEAVALSPDGKLGASGGWDGTIRIWKLAVADERKKPQKNERKREAAEKTELNKQGDGLLPLLPLSSIAPNQAFWAMTGPGPRQRLAPVCKRPMTSFPFYLLNLGGETRIVFPDDRREIGHTKF